MQELFLKALEALDKGRKCAVATVVEAKGSTPRKQGSKMIVYSDGEIFGTIGGGAVEYDVIKEGIKAIKDKRTILKTYKLDAKKGRPICGGQVSIFIEPLEKSLNMVIVGAGHIAVPLSFMAKILGFRVTVIDNRPEFANKRRFPCIDKIMVGSHDKELKKINIGKESFVVLVTHGHKFDFPALKAALKKDIRYIGLIASSTKVLKYFKALKKEGFRNKDLSKIYSPVGLDIGAQTPEEIAVSIIAEIVAVIKGVNHRYKFKKDFNSYLTQKL